MKNIFAILCICIAAFGGGVVGAYMYITDGLHKYLGFPSFVPQQVVGDATLFDSSQTNEQTHPTQSPIHSVDSFAQAVQLAENAVVSIYTSAQSTRANEQQSLNFFADPDPRSSGVGSGVIIDTDGHIITNYHVVSEAAQIFIGAPRKRSFRARIVGTDEETDLALLQADIPNSVAIHFSDSDQLQNGDIVLAIGNPFGVGRTVTMGIVSALGRDNIGINTYERFIQTDTAINPGNSGGALVNTKGELVGINTAIVSNSGNYQGIAFAVPSNQVRRVIDSLLIHGEIIRGWLGVSIHTAYIEKYDREFAEVIGVFSDGPAEVAGIAPGDLLVSINDVAIADDAVAKMHIARVKPGDRLRIRIYRQGKEITLDVISSRRPLLAK